MTDQQFSILVNVLRAAQKITPLEKDILDTWDELHKAPFDANSAYRQIVSNNCSHLDVFTAINSVPNVVPIKPEALTQNDMTFTLRCQLEGLIAKRLAER